MGLFGPTSESDLKLIRAYEETAQERRMAGIRSRKLTGTRSVTYDTLLEQARHYDLDPACDGTGDAEAVWVPFNGLNDHTPWEKTAMAEGYGTPQYVRRYRWRQEKLRSIARSAGIGD